jgi:pimeloyl-ACP methyl ester carboxylesterase
VADAAGPVHAVVAHSMGAVALMLALRDGLNAGRVALVGLPADPVRYAAKVAAANKLDAEERGEMFAILERRSAPFVDLSLSALGATMTVPALLVHSTDDRVAPVSASLETAAAWRGSRVHLAEGLGHRRVLEDATVVAEISSFVAAARTVASANGGLERASIDRPARIG